MKGELDAATAPDLAERIAAFERNSTTTLALDLSEVTFMDVAGMRVLLEASRRAREAERRVVLYNPHRCAQRVFGLTAVDQDLEILFDEESPLA